LLGTVSDVNANTRIHYPQLEDTANVKVQLVRKLPDRKTRRLNVPTDPICVMGEEELRRYSRPETADRREQCLLPT
jgi:hypothetical protein